MGSVNFFYSARRLDSYVARAFQARDAAALKGPPYLSLAVAAGAHALSANRRGDLVRAQPGAGS